MSKLHTMITAWREYPEDYGAAPDDLIRLCESAWKPVSEPPTEEDANDSLEVAIYTTSGVLSLENYWRVEGMENTTKWARTEDVVLLPQSNEK